MSCGTSASVVIKNPRTAGRLIEESESEDELQPIVVPKKRGRPPNEPAVEPDSKRPKKKTTRKK
jgi:hypothetical protein